MKTKYIIAILIGFIIFLTVICCTEMHVHNKIALIAISVPVLALIIAGCFALKT